MYFYIEKEDILHRLHPATKSIALLIFFLSTLMVSHPLYSLIPLGIALSVLIYGGGWGNCKRIVPILLILFGVSIYIWTFLYVDPRADYTWLHILGFAFPRESVFFGVGMGIRISAMLIGGLAFLTVTRVEDFTAGLHRMGLPFGVCFGLSLSFRLLPLFVGTALTISEAQRSRGLELEKGGIIERARKYVPLLVPVFLWSIRSADNLALALESKGFGRKNPRSYLREYHFGFLDVIFLTLSVALLIGLKFFAK